jgi:adenine deaminase
MKTKILRDLLHVVKGIIPPDVVIQNGRIINVFTNSIEEGRIVVIKNGFIVSIEDEKGADTYMDAKTVDAGGNYLAPGFIDAHTHLDTMIPFYEFVPYALRGGTTTVVTETSNAACACGMEGVMALVESTKGYPLRCFFVAPPLTPPFPEMEGSLGLDLGEFSRLLKRDDFVGIGEAYWTKIVEGDTGILRKAVAALNLNKALDGHAAGAREKRLTEYVLTGITSCHESTMVEEVMEKLGLGLYVMIREGWVRRELDKLSKIRDRGVDMRRVMLVSDVFDAVMLCEEGYLDSIVRKAIRLGFSPIEAIKMVTINPADYYHLRHLGALAPLRHADILFLEDLESVAVSKVMMGGAIVHYDGEFTGDAPAHKYGEHVSDSLEAGFVEEDLFRIKAEGKTGPIRVIEVANQTITRPISHKPEIVDGILQGNVAEDIIHVAVLNRKNRKQMGKGFIKGTGIRSGAIATTLIWDTGNILVIGSNTKDMANAINRLVEVRGGTVIVQGSRVIYEFSMPVFGMMPLATMETIRDKTKELEAAMKAIGTSLARPFLTIQTIPFTGLPFLRITDKGLADIKNKRLVPLFLE